MERCSVAQQGRHAALGSYVSRAETFADTLAENVRVSREDISAADIRRSLEMVGLADRVARLPQGVATPLASDGLPLSSNEISRLSIARTLVGKPRLLLVDRLLEGLDIHDCPELVESIFDRNAYGPSSSSHRVTISSSAATTQWSGHEQHDTQPQHVLAYAERTGRMPHVRLQFGGWPAVQFSGGPELAIGWVFLNRVPLGYEIWWRLNGFPPVLAPSAKQKDSGKDGPKPPKIKVG
jgi:hypothetical protein